MIRGRNPESLSDNASKTNFPIFPNSDIRPLRPDFPNPYTGFIRRKNIYPHHASHSHARVSGLAATPSVKSHTQGYRTADVRRFSRIWPLQPQRQPQRAVLRQRSGWTVDVGHGKYRANYHAYQTGRTLTPARNPGPSKSNQPPRPSPVKEPNRNNTQPTARPSPDKDPNRKNTHPLILSLSKDHPAERPPMAGACRRIYRNVGGNIYTPPHQPPCVGATLAVAPIRRV